MMDAATFWSLIDESRKAARGNGDEQVLHLEALLLRLKPAEVVEFDRLFAGFYNEAYEWPLWGAAYVIGRGCSDDGFAYFREWLISRGHAVYRQALADPDSLARIVSKKDVCEVEGLEFLAHQVWSELTGENEDIFPRHAMAYPLQPNGSEWKEDELGSLYPRLMKKFG